ncbi:unnamed protein product [Caenorhabditis nigoni]
MDLTSGFINDNPHYLKICILYEVLQKKPIFDSYRDFCETVGQDPMEYPDFEFWYYRFYHGSRDFDYDRSVDPKPKTIMEIPVGSMTKIVEYLDPVERSRLRSMNHTLNGVVDSFPQVFEKIDITVSNTYIQWTLNSKMFCCFKNIRGCKLYLPNCLVDKSEKCHIKISLEYLAPLMQIPNIQVNHFSLNLLDEKLDCDDLFSIPINAKSVYIYSEQIVKFLSAMNPGYLESISLNSLERFNYQTIFDTDQFKQAKSVEFDTLSTTFKLEELVNFSHLRSFKCRVWTNNEIEDVVRIRDILSTFEKLESCELECHGRWDSVPMREFAEALGEEIPVGPLVQQATITHRYQIPESNEFLEFKITEKNLRCLINIVKNR